MSNIVSVGCYAGATPNSILATEARVVLCHKNPQVAVAVRQAHPQAFIVLRADEGVDHEQYDPSCAPEAEAERFYRRFILPALAAVPPRTYSAAVGPNEMWPGNREGLLWRADFEHRLCELVQGESGLPYLWGSIPVGCLEPADWELFEAVNEEAFACNYHGYLAPGRKHVSEETEPWHLWRPLRLWNPKPKMIFLGECGSYYTSEQSAQLCLEIADAFEQECRRIKVGFLGAAAYGFGLVGDQVPWRLDGTEATFAAAAGGQTPPVATPPPVTPNEPGGKTVMLRLAILPSNQDTNAWAGDNEKAQMERFALQVLSAARQYAAIDARLFTGKPESQDKAHLAGLTAQLKTAYACLDSAPVGTLTVALHLHSDSGATSHVGAYWGDQEIEHRLAVALRGVLAKHFTPCGSAGANYQQQGYVAWTLSPAKHCKVLVECGSHEVARDRLILESRGALIADDLIVALLNLLTLPTTKKPPTPPAPSVEWEKVGYYSTWAGLRVQTKEDPRDLAAYVEHLKAVHKDYRDPYAYGWPVKG